MTARVSWPDAQCVAQTAHEPSYLVKHLLGNLPPVVDRVKLMRKGQAPNGSQEDNFAKMAQSQVCDRSYLRVQHILLHLQHSPVPFSITCMLACFVSASALRGHVCSSVTVLVSTWHRGRPNGRGLPGLRRLPPGADVMLVCRRHTFVV